MKNLKLDSPSFCPRSSCFRHPSDPSTGICPSCLRDRLSDLPPSSDPPPLSRSRSVSNQPSCSYTEPRRASCDVRERNSLSDLLDSQDHKSRKLENDQDDDNDNVDGDEVKTMKEFIDLEVGIKDRKISNGISSVFRKRLRKWKDKQVDKKDGFDGKVRENVDRRRRSCDIEIDRGRASIEEPRASWDGYLVSRTIPSLAPMLYVVENGMLSGGGSRIDGGHRLSVDGQMQAIMEDESSSGGSGVGNSDSLSSQRWSSFDRSSSVRSKKTVGVDSDEAMSVSSVKMSPTKLIVTERELKDWRLKSAKDDSYETVKPVCRAIVPVGSGRDLNRMKKGPTWRKVFNVLGLKAKPPEKKSDSLRGISVDRLLGEGCEKPWSGNHGGLKDDSGFKIKVGGTLASARKSVDVMRLEHSIRTEVDPKAKSSEKKRDNLKGISVDRLLGEGCEKRWSENQGKLKDASDCKAKVGGSLASARKSVDVVTLDRSTRNGVEQQDMSGWKLTRSGSVASSRSSIDFSLLNQSRKSGDKVKESSNCRLARSGSIVGSRRSLDISTRNVSERSGAPERRGEDFVLELNDNARKRSSKVEGEALPFYLMPLRSSRSGRHRS